MASCARTWCCFTTLQMQVLVGVDHSFRSSQSGRIGEDGGSLDQRNGGQASETVARRQKEQREDNDDG